MQVSPLPSGMSWKLFWIVDDVTFTGSMTNGAGVGVTSVVLQFGPRDPMKDVFPTRVLFSTVKLVADVIAIP